MSDLCNIKDVPLDDLRGMVRAEENRRADLAIKQLEQVAKAHGFELKDLVATKRRPRSNSPTSSAERIFQRMVGGASARQACDAEGVTGSTSPAYQAAIKRGHRVVKGYLVKGDGL